MSLEDTPIWTNGPMNLYVNGKPAKVYITSDNVKGAYKNIKDTLAKNGTVPLGIDHLPSEIIENNTILKKLDLLHVGDIHDVDFNDDLKQIVITSAEFTNPLLQKLYDEGELDSVSIVGTSSVDDCPQDYDYVVHETNISRVDIVGKGACTSCIIPKTNPANNTSSVYARLPIMENDNMAEGDPKETTGLTAEEINEVVKTAMAEALKPIEERLSKVEEQLKEEPGEKPEDKPEDGVEAGSASEELAKIEEMKLQAANSVVEAQIAVGKILPAQKEIYAKMAANDLEGFNTLMKEQPTIVDLQGRQSLPGKNEGKDGELSVEEQAIEDVNSYFKKE